VKSSKNQGDKDTYKKKEKDQGEEKNGEEGAIQ